MTTPTADPLAALPWPVRTARLTLRRVTVDDAPAMWTYWQLPEVGRWVTWQPGDPDALREWLGRRLSTLLVIEHDGRIVGDVMVKLEDGWAQREVADAARGVQAELGWALDPAYGGRGLATEALRAVLGLCFDGLGLRRVTANAFAANAPSCRLAQRVGMRRETVTVRESLHRDLGWIDGVGYALLADEWAPSPDARPLRACGAGSA